MECRTKEVDFETFCKTCKYEKADAVSDPCNECLAQGWNEDSRKPICYKERT